MKKSRIILLILLLIFPIISAVEFDMKTNFSQGETLMAKVSGYFLEPILKEDIFFYRGHVRISVDPYVAEIDDEFYIYAKLLDKAPNNYSIAIKNLKYMKGSQISEEDLVKNFSITEDIADFSIDPGFIVTEDDFFIEVQNLQDYKISMEIKNISEEYFIYQESLITLKSGEIKKIDFKLKNVTQPTLSIIGLSTENLKYEIPVYISAGIIEQEKRQRGFKFEPSELNISLSTNSNTTRIIYLYNTGEETLENISLSISNSLKPYLSLSIKEIGELEENSSIKIELYLFSRKEKSIEGQIKAQTSQDFYTYSAIFLNFLKDYVPLDNETRITKTCSEFGGQICNETAECDGESVYTKDGVCCLGSCKEIEKSSAGKIIGWVIVIAVAGFLIWFFKKKYRKAKKPIDLLKIAKGKKR